MNMIFLLIRLISVFTVLVLSILLLYACKSGGRKAKHEKRDSTSTTSIVQDGTEYIKQREAIRLIPQKESSDFQKAKLTISSTTAKSAAANDSVSLLVTYKLSNFKLTDNTKDENSHTMPKSQDMQHIHFILDNEPYIALYKPEHSVKLKKGTQHYLLSFLSASHHKSIKQPYASVLKHFEITMKGQYKDLPIDSTPMLFYSRPKGEYKGEDTKSILLDFYLFNSSQSKDEYRVKANINGKEFLLNSRKAYKIEGLGMGESTITLTLLDKDKNPVSGPNTTISRKIQLSE